MDDLARDVEHAAQHVDVPWDDARQRRIERRVWGGARPALRGWGWVSAAALTALAVGVWTWPERDVERRATAPAQLPAPAAPGPTPAPAATSEPAAEDGVVDPALLQLADGSRARRLSADTRLDLRVDEPGHVALDLTRGDARFEVTAQDTLREFVVQADTVRVRVLAAAFEMRRSGDAVAIVVERGQVQIEGPDGKASLEAGEAGRFPFEAEVRPDPAPQRRKRRARVDNEETAVAVPWDALARDGDYAGAYRALRAGEARLADPSALLLAADVARYSGHPADASRYLERFLKAHAGDPRAALAAFTLGRVLLEELGQPARAARSFARVRALNRNGELAQDALAREVESWSRAGQAGKAATRAQEYLQAYPRGRRAGMVRRLGGVE